MVCGPSGRAVMGLIQCLLVLEFKTRCQKFPNVTYTLSPSSAEPVSLMFYRKYWWKNQNKCIFDWKHIAGKTWGHFWNPGIPPIALSVSVLSSGSCWHNSCKVPLFHLVLWSVNMSQRHTVQVIIRWKVHCVKPCTPWEVEVQAPADSFVISTVE